MSFDLKIRLEKIIHTCIEYDINHLSLSVNFLQPLALTKQRQKI